MWRQSSANGVPIGKWMTMRRTDDSIHAPSFSKRSRKVLTWARAYRSGWTRVESLDAIVGIR